MIIPNKFKCAGTEISVVKKPCSENFYGEFISCEDSIIIYDNILNDCSQIKVPDRKQLNTFFHELIHVFQHHAGMEFNEIQAQTFANFLQEFLETYE